MIRKQFQHCTVITIAHRIETIVDSDYILVMNDGAVAEFAPPDELLAHEQSLFNLLLSGVHDVSMLVDILSKFRNSHHVLLLCLLTAKNLSVHVQHPQPTKNLCGRDHRAENGLGVQVKQSSKILSTY